MDNGYLVVSAAITIVSFILLLVSFHSYRISGNKKLLFVFGVFLCFFVRGALLSLGLFFSVLTWVATSYYTWIIDLLILTLLYIASLKR